MIMARHRKQLLYAFLFRRLLTDSIISAKYDEDFVRLIWVRLTNMTSENIEKESVRRIQA
jgi:hypothetical protein